MRFAVSRWSRGVRMVALCGLALVGGLAMVVVGSPRSAWASSSCPNEIFRTGPGATLPDCRAYELVSPPNKNGGEVDGGLLFEGTGPAPEQAALNGEAVTYGSQTTFTEANPLAGAVTDQYLSRRGPTGWSTQELTPKQDLPGGSVDVSQGALELNPFQGFSEDLEHAFLLAYEPSPVAGAPVDYFNPYLRDNAGEGSYQLLSTRTPPVATPGMANNFEGLRIQYGGMSADGSHVVFEANDALTADATPGQEALYESSEGHLELVSKLPHGEQASGVVAFGSREGHESQANLDEGYLDAVSADGSRVFWTNQHLYVGSSEEQVYMHELTPGGARTVLVSASQKTDGTGPGGTDPAGTLPAVYRAASRNASKVFFTSCEKLTNDSTADDTNCGLGRASFKEAGEDIYMYEPSGTAAPGRLTDITVDQTPGQAARVDTVLGVSEDGSYVYFIADGVLAAGATVGGPGNGNGFHNLYVWHNGTVSFIAKLTETDYGVAKANILEPFAATGSLYRVSPNGQYLVFESSEPLTGYDSTPSRHGACETVPPLGSFDNDRTGRCIEVYEYDASSGRLICASCNENGLPPVGNSVVPSVKHALLNELGWQSPTVQQRYLLEDGRVFFDSDSELVPQASNGKLNVYEYEPQGVGDCQREGGCVALISSGTSSENSYFMDAGASGNDVFFITREQLVAEDGDEALDVYDARVDGGFSAPVAPPCGGDACHPPVTPAPAIYQAPPSATFVGPGNSPQPAVQPASTPKSKTKAKVKKKSKKGKRKRSSKRARKSARGSRVHGSSRGGRR